MLTNAARVPLFTRDDLADERLSSRAIRKELDAQRLQRVRPGVYLRTADAAALTPEEREVVRARAWAIVASEPPVFGYLTAAAILGLPIPATPERRVHVVVPESRSGAAVGLIRHRGPLADDEIIETGGLRCTDVRRTVADVARTQRFETAVCITDAALRSVASPGHGVYLFDRAAEFRQGAMDVAARSAHGLRHAVRAIEFSDGRAQLPGESISRIRLRELGFAPPDLQVRIPGPDGEYFYADFGLDDVWSFGEFDGKGKYSDPWFLNGLTPEAALDREKQREDWIRGTTQRRFARWGSRHIRTADDLGARLGSFGIEPPRNPAPRP